MIEFEYYIKNQYKNTNYVVAGKLNAKNIDVLAIAKKQPSVKYQKRVSSAVVFKNKYGNSSKICSLYNDGRITSMGASDLASALCTFEAHIHIINKIFGVRCRSTGAYIANVVSGAKIFPIDIDRMREAYPNLFPPKNVCPALYFKCRDVGMDTNIVLGIFGTGNITLMGGKNEQELVNTLRIVYFDYLVHFKKECPENDALIERLEYL